MEYRFESMELVAEGVMNTIVLVQIYFRIDQKDPQKSWDLLISSLASFGIQLLSVSVPSVVLLHSRELFYIGPKNAPIFSHDSH